MDIHNIANLESPLYNTLVSKAQRDPWTYSLLANVPSFSKQRVEVQASSGGGGDLFTSEKTFHFKIPRYGLLSRCVLKTKLEVACEAGNQNAITAGLGWYIYKDVTLQTHNKRIQQLTPEYMQMRSLSLPREKRKAAENRVGFNITDGGFVANTHQNVVKPEFWTDLPFAFAERPQNFLDTRFVENLEIVATANKAGAYGNRMGTQVYDSGTTSFPADAKYAIDPSYPVLVCYFINPTEELYRAYQERNFTLERPLTMLWYDIFVESPENGLGNATITKKLDCNNLVYATHFMVRCTEVGIAATAATTHATVNGLALVAADGTSGDNVGGAACFEPVKEVIVKGTSRELINTTGHELMTVDQETYGRFAQLTAAGRIKETDAIYTINWGLDGSRTSCSGALSMKNISAPTLSVTLDNALDAKKYDLIVIHEFFQLVSIQGSDGRVSVGVSV